MLRPEQCPGESASSAAKHILSGEEWQHLRASRRDWKGKSVGNTDFTDNSWLSLTAFKIS